MCCISTRQPISYPQTPMRTDSMMANPPTPWPKAVRPKKDPMPHYSSASFYMQLYLYLGIKRIQACEHTWQYLHFDAFHAFTDRSEEQNSLLMSSFPTWARTLDNGDSRLFEKSPYQQEPSSLQALKFICFHVFSLTGEDGWCLAALPNDKIAVFLKVSVGPPTMAGPINVSYWGSFWACREFVKSTI